MRRAILAGLIMLAAGCGRGEGPAEAVDMDQAQQAVAEPAAGAGVAARSVAGYAGPEPAAKPVDAPARAVLPPGTTPAMIIRTGHATLQVDSVDAAVAALERLAARLGGWVAGVTVEGGRDQQRRATLELKLPADRFAEAAGGLAPVGRVERLEVSAQDVGEEFVDLEARADNARRLEARLLELVDRRTGKLSDVLDTERELARVRQEIERIEGRLRFLRQRTAYSTLVVAVHERLPLVGQPGPNPIADAFRQAWRNFIALTAAAIASLGVLLPVGALAGLLLVGARRLRRRPADA